MDLKGLLDMEYFWWVFTGVLGLPTVFLVIFIAIKAAGWLMQAIIDAFRGIGRS